MVHGVSLISFSAQLRYRNAMNCLKDLSVNSYYWDTVTAT